MHGISLKSCMVGRQYIYDFANFFNFFYSLLNIGAG